MTLLQAGCHKKCQLNGEAPVQLKFESYVFLLLFFSISLKQTKWAIKGDLGGYGKGSSKDRRLRQNKSYSPHCKTMHVH